MDKVLLSWVGNEEIESYSPRCSTINRLFSALSIDFKTKIIGIDSELKGASEKLRGLPIIIDGNKKIMGQRNCINYLRELRGESEIFQLTDEQRIQEQILFDWCLSSLHATTVYFQFKDISGLNGMRKRILKSAKLNGDTEDTIEDVANPIKEALLNYVSGFEIMDMDKDEAIAYFDAQVSYINEMLGNKQFLFGHSLKVIDIAIYTHFSRALLPGLAATEHIKRKYNRVIRWLLKVAAQTRSSNNIYPSHLES